MKVLLVDDSKAMRLIVRRTLREAGFGDHEYVEKQNGKEALDYIRDQQPDFVLSDWNMPEMTGIELLKQLRAEGNRVKFGFITSEGSSDILAEATGSGALFLIVKPFGADKFQDVLTPHLKGEAK